MRVLLRTAGDPIEAAPALRRTVASLDPDLPISHVRTLASVVASGTAGPRLSATLVGVFSVVALLLAALGLYGVISYSVLQRTHELGIRTALGARPADVMRLVMTQGVALMAGGLAVGFALSLALGRALASQLYGIAPNDPWTLGIVGAVLALVGLAAAAVPAARATRIDPVAALRQE
jgi:putative ABC transport system permease protein